jgi:hypothetical protein
MELGRVPRASAKHSGGWPGLTHFLDDGRIELDNNPGERAIRLFAGSDGAPSANAKKYEPFA